MDPMRRLVNCAAITVVLLAAGCTGVDGSGAAGSGDGGRVEISADEPAGPAVLAFIDAEGVALVDATGRTTRVAPATGPTGALIWSPDGSRLAWQDSPPEGFGSAGEVHVVENATETRFPCTCQGIAFLNNDLAALSTDGAALLLFPSGSGVPRRVVLTTPQPAGSALVGGGDENVTVAVPLPEEQAQFRGQFTFVTVDGRGSVEPLLGPEGLVSFNSGLASPGDDRFAWIDSPSGGACFTTSDLRVIDRTTGAVMQPPRPSDPPFESALLPDGQRAILSQSWAGQGTVVTFGPQGGCQPVYPHRLVSYFLELDSDRWRFLGTGLLAAAFGAEGRAARLEAINPAPSEPQLTQGTPNGPPRGVDHTAGRLIFTTSVGDARPIGDHVISFLFTPEEAAEATAPPSIPAPPASPTTTDWKGKALPEPFAELMNDINETAVRKDVGALVALCARCDQFTIEWLESEPAASDLLALLSQTHPLANDGTNAVVPSLAIQSCADVSGIEATCTAEQIQDITHLALEADYDLAYNGPSYSYTGAHGITMTLDEQGLAIWTGTTLGG